MEDLDIPIPECPKCKSDRFVEDHPTQYGVYICWACGDLFEEGEFDLGGLGAVDTPAVRDPASLVPTPGTMEEVWRGPLR